MAACFLGFVAALVGAFFIALAMVQIPQPNDFATSQATLFDYADGRTQIAHVGTNRVSVPMSQIPLDVRHAILAAEDRSFYTEPGISPLGTLRALRNDVGGSGDLQGGSTITQQYVKNYYLTEKQTVSRKLTEALLAVKIDDEVPKDTVLQNYLNTVFFARGTYGVETASRAYFGVPVADLANDPAKAAYLAALVQSPYYYSSADTDPAAAKLLRARWNYVLNGMVTEGWLPAAQRATLTFPTPIAYQPNDLAGMNGYMVNAATRYLDALHKNDPTAPDSDMLARGGYTVVTTFRPEYMKAANDTVTKDLASLRASNPGDRNVHVGLAAVDNISGAVLGFYGGPNYVKQGYNDALQAKGPLGSDVVTPVLERSVAEDGEQGKNWPGTVAALAHMGITDAKPADDPPADDDLSTSPLHLAAAYETVGKPGNYHEPFEVTEVLRGGQVVWQAAPPHDTNAYDDAAFGVLDRVPWVQATDHDGANQWAWSAGSSFRISVAVDMYATAPNPNKNRSLKNMTPLPPDAEKSLPQVFQKSQTSTTPKTVATTRTHQMLNQFYASIPETGQPPRGAPVATVGGR